MKVVIAIDSFKGSMSSMEAGNAVREGILEIHKDADVVVKPLADGGEGTTDALIEGLGGERIEIQVKGPFGTPVTAQYGYIKEKNLAVMEMASAAGITLSEQRDAMKATTYGVGEMILDAIHRGVRKFIIGIGGSATNDGGTGMLQALGYQFLDKDDNVLGEGGEILEKIAKIKESDKLDILSECEFRIACDVENPLTGKNGATYIYGPQKGVTEVQLEVLDAGMKNYAEVTEYFTGERKSEVPGAGAAGGLGFAFLSYLNGQLTPGVELIMQVTELEKEMTDADIVVTGEGRLDHQTAMGKAPVGVAKLGKKYGARTIAFAGSVTPDAEQCNDAGIDAYFPILREIVTLEQAMQPECAKRNLKATAKQVFRLL